MSLLEQLQKDDLRKEFGSIGPTAKPKEAGRDGVTVDMGGKLVSFSSRETAAGALQSLRPLPHRH